MYKILHPRDRNLLAPSASDLVVSECRAFPRAERISLSVILFAQLANVGLPSGCEPRKPFNSVCRLPVCFLSFIWSLTPCGLPIILHYILPNLTTPHQNLPVSTTTNHIPLQPITTYHNPLYLTTANYTPLQLTRSHPITHHYTPTQPKTSYHNPRQPTATHHSPLHPITTHHKPSKLTTPLHTLPHPTTSHHTHLTLTHSTKLLVLTGFANKIC
jgi:hypothetical protein